ncbi:pyrroloquinoline quinone biosynthesis peptide chaperone PqqD [Paraburkholderia heleia]|uniref:pyrroloquinoline quinone biosynthesis peptide chaperone PqqD n=1 Tax=Paraburkholderia heleia TaxID=634127 RepID=UPI0005A83E87|nr:pyrroloquinoline quinone biosynthesis peptide chaperone PqqD [Paraburkholderia heleia]
MNAQSSPEDALPALTRPTLSKRFRLQWEPAQNAHVLLYPEGMVQLNPSAAQILLRCDGTREMHALIADLERAFDTAGIGPEVRAFVSHAQERGWLE